MNAPSTAVALQSLPAGHDRRKYLGGADAASVIGVSPYGTPLDLFYKKTAAELEAIDEKKAKFFRNRKAQEPIIAARLESEYGVKVTRLSIDDNPNRYVDPEFPFMVAEIDGEFLMSQAVRECFPARADFAAVPDGTLCNLEFKTSHPLAAGKFGEEGTDDWPYEYLAQAEWGLGVTRRPVCLGVVLIGIDDLLCYPTMADQEFIADMRAKAVKFWTEHVLTGTPPDPICVEDVVKLYRGFGGKPVELSDEAYEALRALDVSRGNVRAIENEQAELEWCVARCVAFQWGTELEASKSNKPVIAANENAMLMHAGGQAGTWNRQTRNGIDVTRLRKEKPEIASAYSTESQFRVFRTKKSKGA